MDHVEPPTSTLNGSSRCRADSERTPYGPSRLDSSSTSASTRRSRSSSTRLITEPWPSPRSLMKPSRSSERSAIPRRAMKAAKRLRSRTPASLLAGVSPAVASSGITPTSDFTRSDTREPSSRTSAS